MTSELYALRITLALLILAYASLLDWRYREIDDKSWVSMVALGAAFAAYDYLTIKNLALLKLFALSLLASIILALALYYSGLMGGGDGKILIGIAAMFPLFSGEVLSVFPLFVLSVFVNAIFLSASLPLFFFLRNLKHIRSLRSRSEFAALFLGYRKPASEIKSYEIAMEEQGRFKIFIDANKIELGKKPQNEGEIWVTPALPFVIPITLGFVLSLFYGDVLSYIIVRLAG